MRVLYLYPGDRTGKYDRVGDFPDTGAYGLTRLSQEGIEAHVRHVKEMVPLSLLRFVPFALRHILSFFLISSKDDVVIGPSLLLTTMPLLFFKKKAKFVLLNFSVNRQLVVHTSGWRRKILEWQLQKMDLVISLSHAQDTELVRACPFLKEKTTVIPLGVDAQFFTPVFEGREEFILSGGRDDGRDYATLALVARRLPERRFVVFCSKRNLEGIDMPENVEVHFNVPIKELRTLYQTAHCLLLLTHPDGYTEGSDCSGQTVLLDALASGLPVIATKKAYMSDYVEDGKHISLVEPYAADEVVEAVNEFDDHLLHERLARAARLQVEDHLNSAVFTRSLAASLRAL